MPLVSVVMTVHNGARYLREAIDSVLSQQLESLELWVVDDASSDETWAELERCTDPRVRRRRLVERRGPFAAANIALAECEGRFIARLDADDVAERERLEAQVDFLRRHPAVGLVGSSCLKVDAEGRPLGVQAVPPTDLAIRLRALLAPPFVHSTTLWRAELGLRYDASLRVAGDYDLWTRALECTQARNLEAPLVRYRVWDGGITATQSEQQQATQDLISARQLRRQFPQLTFEHDALVALRRWSLKAPGLPPPPAAQRLLDALEAAALGAAAHPDFRKGLTQALVSPLGAWGQPLDHASWT